MNEYFEEEYREVFGAENPVIPLSRKIWLTWEDVKFQVPRNRGIWGVSGASNYESKLKGIWGGVGPGEIVAILGEINSGKTFLLNILSGHLRIKRGDLLTGRVLVNGFRRGQRWRKICAHVTYTQSQEELHGDLSVTEQLEFCAHLALPSKWPVERRQRVINWVLDSLNLQLVKHKPVETLSTSERKQLSIGLALVGLPRVLLIDEPTEGLDPTRALELMKSIQKITLSRQMSTIITAKQLRQATFPLIDRFLLLGQGATVYYGTLSDALIYFERNLHISIPKKDDNPLACMLDAISCFDCRQDPSHLYRIQNEWEAYAFDHQLYRPNYPTAPDQFNDNHKFEWQRSWFVEFREQLIRTFFLFYRNYVFWVGQTVMALVLGLLVAFSAFQVDKDIFSTRARINVLYYTAVFFQFFPFITFLFICYRDKQVLRRERRDSLVRVSPVYLAGWLVIYSFRLVIVTLYTVIVYFIVGLRLPFNFALVFWFTLLAEAWVSMGMGYLIVTLVDNMAIAETTGSIILLLCIWYSGDFAYNRQCTWILRWLAYLSPIFYAFDALVNNEFNGTGSKGEEFINETGLNTLGVWASIGTLLGLGFVYMIIGYFALSINTRPNHKYI